MANPEHLEILKQGVEQWNKWRKVHPDVRPNLSEADLFRANLSAADVVRARLSGADLSAANATMLASLINAAPVEANLQGADLRGARLEEANLSRADLSAANLSGADLNGANFSAANLRAANLTAARLGWAKLSDANLSEANLRGADLLATNLRAANLREANFTEARAMYTSFDNVDLSAVRGLESINHRGRSTVGVDTIYKSRGKIPEVFLRGCGVPDNFIAYMHSLTGQAFEFYSCFISYSSRDQEFAERLHADLQAKGVRCWFAEEDLKIGDKFQERIEESIRYHDKLLLVRSENSIQSPWVGREVQAAFEREQRSNKLVLFPIRLDEAVMETPKAWAADIRRTRHIGEFNRWPDHDSYKRALERLLRDLKAETPA